MDSAKEVFAMKEKKLVRILESELENFKNVEYGDIRYVNYSNAEYRAELKEPDINGIYGQNGSGKTAMIEALDMLQRIMGGKTISYEEYAGMFPENSPYLALYFFSPHSMKNTVESFIALFSGNMPAYSS